MSRIKRKEAELAAQLTNFIEAMNPGLLTQAGVSTAEYTAVTGGTTTFQGDRENVELTASAARGAVQQKDASERAVRRAFQTVIDKFYATASISNATLASLGLPPRNAGNLPTPPIQVVNLRCDPKADGTASLRWSRSGNSKSTIFLIEASTEGGPFVVLGQTLRVNFVDYAATPGVEKSYRIVAVNGVGRATPSVSVTIYNEGDTMLSIAA